MSYTAAINRANPTAFLFLIDQSRSMNEKMDAGESKAKFVGDVFNKTLFQLISRCTATDGIRNYFDVGVLAYNGDGVHCGFAGALDANSLQPISSLAAHPLRIEQRKKRVPDGAGGLVDQSVKLPVWFESVSDGDTPMSEGFRKAAEWLVGWCNSHVNSYPPTMIHVAGGPSTDGDPQQLAEAIRHISTNHGQCLLFNLHVGTSGSASVIFPASETNLPDTYSKVLFRMSSLIPTHLLRPAQEKGYSASSESRFFGYRSGYEGLVNFFDIATRVSDLLLKESIAPQSNQTSAKSITGSGTNNKSHQLNPRPAEPAKPQPVEATAGPAPAELASRTVIHGRRPTWLLGIGMLGLAGVIAGTVVFKPFVTGSGPQPTQLSSQMPSIESKDGAASKGQSSDNGQSTGPSPESTGSGPQPTQFSSRMPTIGSNDGSALKGQSDNGQSIGPSPEPNGPPTDSISERSAALLPDVKTISPPTDDAPKPAGGAEQPAVPTMMPPPKNIDQSKVAETSAVDRSAPTLDLDLAKVPDAKRVQQRLIELGYLSGVADGVWGLNSKRALSDFRTAEKMGQDDKWDQATEMKLFSSSTARRQQNLAFVGGWALDASSCANALVKITANRATSAKATCDFNSIRQVTDSKWRAQAHCELAPSLRTADTENSWTANIKLTLEDRRLTWESEMGLEEYSRCSQ
jgi:hypothetical protein